MLPSQTLPKSGPGRNENGNFVLTEVTLEQDGKPLKISNATATFEQPKFPAKNAIDGNKAGRKNGWGVLGNAGKESSLYLELSEEQIDYVAAALAGWEEDGECTAFGHQRRLSAAGAAAVNGIDAHGEDFDDKFEGGTVHAGAGRG